MKVLQIHPTLKCNLNCEWCAYGQQFRNPNSPVPIPEEELPFDVIEEALLFAHRQGCRILKISGGGEPTIYPHILTVLSRAKSLGYEIHLQTNGIALTNAMRKVCDDIRISCGDGRKFKPPRIQPNGFSYVVSCKPDFDNLNRLIEYAVANRLYVRVTQDDTHIENIPSIAEIQNNIFVCSDQGSVRGQRPLQDITRRQTNTGVGFSGHFIKSGVSEAERLNPSEESIFASSPRWIGIQKLAAPSRVDEACPENQGNSGGGASLLSPIYRGRETKIRFWDAKDYHPGRNPCPCFDSPLLGADKFWYPCCKTHCAKEIVPGYNTTMRLGMTYPDVPYDGSSCRRCYY